MVAVIPDPQVKAESEIPQLPFDDFNVKPDPADVCQFCEVNWCIAMLTRSSGGISCTSPTTIPVPRTDQTPLLATTRYPVQIPRARE
jgi:hypothetical protein